MDTLKQFGTNFHSKVIAIFLTDQPFVEQSFDMVKKEYFESEANQWLIECILTYFATYKKLPTADVLKIELNKITNDVLKVSVVNQVKVVSAHFSDEDLDYVKKTFLDFCKNQELKNAILDSVDLLKDGKYDNIKVRIDKAIHAGAERDLGHMWKDELDSRVVDDARECIKTPWPVITSLMDGGLGAGELGVVAAPSAAGKSWLLVAIGAEALRNGKRVVHYTLELNQKYVGLRYDTVFAGVEPSKIRLNVDKVRNIIEKTSGELIIKYFPPRAATPNTLYAHIQRLESAGMRPDLVIIDYADLLRSAEKAEARYQELGFIYEQIRGMLGEFGVPGWTASQTQRCLVLSTMVNTQSGPLEIRKLSVGDKIETIAGFKPITKIYPIEKQPVYKITLKSGKIITCSVNHEFPINNKKLLSIASGLKIGDKLLTKK